jgi:carboxypeptidase Q
MPVLHPFAFATVVLALPLLAGSSAQALAAAPQAATAQQEGEAPSPKDKPGSFAIISGKKAPIPQIPMGDPAIIARIIDEGQKRNQVMSHLEHLCLEIGPRLTGSTRLEEANRWTRDQFEKWGLTNARIEQWGEIPVRFDRGPSSGKVLLVTTRPSRAEDTEGESSEAEVPETYRTLREMEFTTLAWMAGTDGPARGHIVRMPRSEEEYLAVKEQLDGAWILIPRLAEGERQGVADRRRGFMGVRYNQRKEAMQKVADGEDPASLPVEQRIIFDGVKGFISASRDERVWTSSVPDWRTLDLEKMPKHPEVSVRLSDYDFINSRLTDGDRIVVEFDLQHDFTPGPIPLYNTIAEIRGTVWPDEYVIVSAHLDSWDGPGSQGTTDNGTGSAVTMEAARILMAVGARPKRTIKFILWSGEEQGLLGSLAYVAADEERLSRISAVFVDDGGTNFQGGLRCTQDMVPMLAAATAPLNNVFSSETDAKSGAAWGPFLNINIRPQARLTGSAGGGGSDHASFIRAGVPGFFWDEIGRADYLHGWHTQYDRIDLAIPEYLFQSATASAVTAYNLACAPTLLPRERPVREGESEEGERPARPRRGQQPESSSPAGESR